MKFNAKMPRAKPAPGTAYIVVSVKDARGNRFEIEGLYLDSALADLAAAIKGKDVKQDREPK
jgi:hypothetical protein